MATPVETRADYGTEPDADWSYWRDQLQLADKEHDDWAKRGREVVKRYRDERALATSSGDNEGKRFNILWSNTEVLKPACYFHTPVPAVERRFKDGGDPVARMASTVIERCLTYSVDPAGHDFDAVMRSSVEDMLLPGRGVAWERYVPTFGPEQKGSDGKTFRPVVYEESVTDYVYWEDFRCAPARRFAEVPWVARRSYMTRKALTDRFTKPSKTEGKSIGEAMTLDYTPPQIKEADAEKPVNDGMKKATVWEIWSKEERKVVWFAPAYKDGLLDETDPPLTLANFFPCPRPLTAVTTNDKLLPIPEYCLYQDQAKEIDELTHRISCLVKAVKAVGVYDASAEGLGRLLDEGYENKLIPVENWAGLIAQSGGKGLAGVISMLPLNEVAEALLELYNAREKSKAELYEVTGIADLIRGQGNAGATATAERIKGQFATLRLQDRQQEVQRFARDIFRIKAEVIAENFSPETLKSMTGLSLPTQAEMQVAQLQAQQGQQAPVPQGPTWEEVIAFLRDDGLRSYRIDVETDSTIAIDEQAEKQARVEFLTAITPFMERVVPTAMANPAMADLAGEMIMFAVHAFRAGRSLETAFEAAVDKLKQQAAQPKPEAQDPAMVEAQGRLQIAGQKQQADQAATQAAAQLEMERMQAELQQQAAKDQADARNEQLRLANDARKIEVERELKLQEGEHKRLLAVEELAMKERVEAAKVALHDSRERDAMALAHGRERERINSDVGLKRESFDKTQAFERSKTAPKPMRRQLKGVERGADNKIVAVTFHDQPVDEKVA